jgi:hypothetical protein
MWRDRRASRITGTETRTVGLLCWGACGQSHATASLLAVVDVLHDERGIPAEWQLVRSSGDDRFDASALEAIGDALDAAPDGVLAFERPAEWSRWSFASTAYEWSRDELILDPQFEPPGQVLESKSGVLGLVTATREVRLVAVLYREAARERSGGDPGRGGGDP